jgi:hypothetical protein
VNARKRRCIARDLKGIDRKVGSRESAMGFRSAKEGTAGRPVNEITAVQLLPRDAEPAK